MPIYEFRCQACHKKSSLLVRGSASQPCCSHCGSTDLERLVSTFAYHRSQKDIQETSGDPDRPGLGYYNDPRNIGRWAEKRFDESGMEMPPELKQRIEAAREGELPPALKELQPGPGEI